MTNIWFIYEEQQQDEQDLQQKKVWNSKNTILEAKMVAQD